MKLKNITSIFVVLFYFATNAQNIQPPQKYTAYRTADSIKIDGLANELSWEKAPWTTTFIDIEGKKEPKHKTKLKMLWDEHYLYFYANMEEPHIWGTLKQRDTIIFYNNDFEIFIDPDGDTHNYMEFEINALNTVWDLFLEKPYRESGKVLNNWDIKGMKTAVHIDGTLNNPTDIDNAWSVEIAMPWNVLLEASAGKIPENKFWRLNFSRVHWDFDLKNNQYKRKKDPRGKYLPEYNWVWSPQGVINMHEPEHWGYVYFSAEKVTENHSTIFEIPKNEYIKWKMYQWYRLQKQFKQKNGSWISDIKILNSTPITIQGQSIHPLLEVHSQGWNISVKSPFTNDLLVIEEDGSFYKKNER